MPPLRLDIECCSDWWSLELPQNAMYVIGDSPTLLNSGNIAAWQQQSQLLFVSHPAGDTTNAVAVAYINVKDGTRQIQVTIRKGDLGWMRVSSAADSVVHAQKVMGDPSNKVVLTLNLP